MLAPSACVDTEFFSPNGLDDRGRSTVGDLVVLTRAAYDAPGFARIVASKFRTIPAPRGRPRRVQNRNALLWLYPGAIGVKTGFTASAGYCLIATAERGGPPVVAVVLGDRNEAFSEAATLLDHGFEAFQEQRSCDAGEGDRHGRHPGWHGCRSKRLERSAHSCRRHGWAMSRERVVILAGAAFPPAPGERVGTLKVTIPGVPLGSSAADRVGGASTAAHGRRSVVAARGRRRRRARSGEALDGRSSADRFPGPC